jgi:diaminohydroxyphosphoribosylaminopyrimidine deaminase/5-amino-6-(5-phosphoribosylamino)uracil reductase
MASLMRRALFLAQSNLGATAPNPSVGAVIADPHTGEIVASAVTAPGGRPHAEAQALQAAGERAKGAVVFCTLEPCSHSGVTPPCAHALAEAGVATLVYGSFDPDPRVAGRGLAYLESRGIKVLRGDFVKEADWLNLGHALRVTESRPFVQIKLAMDANGRVPTGAGGKPVWVTGEAARAQGHLLRARADAILVGRKTVEADDPDLTCRLPGLEDRSPIRVVLAASGALPANARLFARPAPPVWIFCADASKCAVGAGREGVRVFEAGTAPDGGFNLRSVLERLAGEGITRLLVEGGPATALAFLNEGLADEVILMQSETALNAHASLPVFGSKGMELVISQKDYILAARSKAGPDTVSVYRSTAHWQG